MKKLLLLTAALISLAACSNVRPGHVGIKVNSFGGSAGVENESKGVGAYLTPPGTNIYEYPVYTSTYAFTKSSDEGSRSDESIDFQDKSGLSLNSDVSVSFRIDAKLAPVLYQKYRLDMQGIVNGPLRSSIRNAIVEVASTMQIDEIYGSQKSVLINKALEQVRSQFASSGLVVENLYWANNIRMPKSISDQITKKTANEQAALAAQANVATVTANGEARLAQATAEAKAMAIQGDAIRSNPEIIQMRAVEKWDGRYPQYVGGGMPLPQLQVK